MYELLTHLCVWFSQNIFEIGNLVILVIATWIANKGLSAWKEETRWKKGNELATETIETILHIKDQIEDVRNRRYISWYKETNKASHQEMEKHHRNSLEILIQLARKLKQLSVKLRVTEGRGIIEISDLLHEIDILKSDFNYYYSAGYNHKDLRNSDEEANDTHEDFFAPIGKEQDMCRENINKQINNIELLLQKYIKF